MTCHMISEPIHALLGAHCCAFRRQEIELDGSEIAECAWLPLEEYVASTEELATERGVGDTMNSWLMRNVAVELRAGSPPSFLQLLSLIILWDSDLHWYE